MHIRMRLYPAIYTQRTKQLLACKRETKLRRLSMPSFMAQEVPKSGRLLEAVRKKDRNSLIVFYKIHRNLKGSERKWLVSMLKKDGYEVLTDASYSFVPTTRRSTRY